MRTSMLIHWPLAVLISLVSLISIQAHPISMGQAYINVERTRVDVELAIMVEDLVLYQELTPGTDQKYSVDSIREAAEKHKAFLVEHFQIRDTDGSLVPGQATSMSLAEVEAVGEAIEPIDIMRYFIRYRLEFTPEAPLPYLTLLQRFGGLENPLPAVVDVALYREEALVSPPFKLEHNKPQVFEFDWEAPPQEVPRTWRERKQIMDAQLREKLGITSYGSVYAFLYITDTEVRHEILVPLLILETWFDLPRENPDIITVAEQEAAQDKLAAFFADNNPVAINGERVDAQLDRLRFFSLDIRDFAKDAEPKDLSAYNARVGVILSYPTEAIPSSVGLQWETFNATTTYLRLGVYEFEKAPIQFYLVPERAVYDWVASEERKPIAIEPISVPPNLRPRSALRRIKDKDASSALGALLHNMYSAFASSGEEAVYDGLSYSVEGELLTELYLQWIEGLRMEEQGGAVANVKEVAPLEITAMPASDSGFPRENGLHFDARAAWAVTGDVEHWGHIHTRRNRFDGVFRVANVSGVWKITDFRLEAKERLSFETGLRLAR